MSPLRRCLNVMHRFQRAIHLYGGLFVSPFVVIYAISAILLNHPQHSGEPSKWAVREKADLDLSTQMDSLSLARHIMEQVGVSGEIEFFRHEPQQERLVIPVMRPGYRGRITVDVEKRTAQIEERRTTASDTLRYLHKSPGPHLAGFRGNWFVTRIWRWLADATACLLLLISASGVYLWALFKAERRTGLISLGIGLLSFCVLMTALAY